MSSKKLDIYLSELLKWNKKFNLTSITEEDEVRLKHFDDSMSLETAYDFSKGVPAVLDVGSGAGLPGIPLKILFPNIKLTLLDSVKKKTEFLKHISDVLGLKNVCVIWSRAEDHIKDNREQFDVVVCRALAPLNIAVELCLPFAKIGGIFIAMKAKDAEKEMTEAEKAIDILGGRLEKIIKANLVDEKKGSSAERSLIVIKKEKMTPEKYPRKAGIPQKRPL